MACSACRFSQIYFLSKCIPKFPNQKHVFKFNSSNYYRWYFSWNYGNWNATKVLRKVFSFDQYCQFCQSVCTSNQHAFLHMLSRFVQGYFCDLCIMSCVLTLWTPSYCFANGIIDKKYIYASKSARGEGRMEKSWNKIYNQYKFLQSLSYCINMAMGNQLIFYIFESLIYYSLNLNAVLTTTNNFKRVDMILFYVITLGIFIISADACNQVLKFL